MKLGFFTFWDFAAISQLRNEGHCAAKWHSCAEIGFAAAKYPAKWSFGRGIFYFLFLYFFFRSHFRSCEMRFTVLRNGTRVPKSASQLPNTLRNGGFHALVVRSRFRSCEMGAPVLRSGTRVPKVVSQLRKFLQRGA